MPQNTDFPDGVTNANWFSLFNAISFQIFLGAPMVLYAKSLGASATLLGVLASLTPLLTIFQIPAAHYLQRFGYRRFVLAGWSTRNLCVFAVTLVPLLTFLSNGWKLVLLLGLLFVFNLLRGISSGAWFPWITELLPEEVRGRFLSRDQRFMQTGSLVALLFCGLVLQKDSLPWEFSVIFLISGIGGAISLVFLNRMPDVQAPEKLKKSGTRVPWREIITFPPFARLVFFNLLYVFTFGSVGVFTLSFLKGRAGLGENQILLFLTASFISALMTLPTAGKLLDAIGSKRFLRYALALHIVFICGWIALAAGLLAPSVGVIVGIFIVAGAGGSGAAIANSRLTMNTMPEMGRSHFFAFYTVITSFCLGLSPIVWGVAIDAMNALKHATGPFEWNRYSAYFVAILTLAIATLFSTAALREEPLKRNTGQPDRDSIRDSSEL